MAEEEYQEITLADLVDTLVKRKVIVIVTLLLAVGIGAVLSSTEPVTHVAEASFVPLGSTTIITSYLDSHQAAKDILAAEGDTIRPLLDPDGEMTDAQMVEEIREMTRIKWSDPVVQDPEGGDRVLITARVEADDEQVAVAIAEAYLTVLPTIRPFLQEEYEDTRFNFYFARTEHLALNVTEARELARGDAERKEFWFIFDEQADVKETGGDSNLKLNLALGVVLGLMLGVFAAFTAEWWSNYRAERRARAD